jgi:hypothetical protein
VPWLTPAEAAILDLERNHVDFGINQLKADFKHREISPFI